MFRIGSSKNKKSVIVVTVNLIQKLRNMMLKLLFLNLSYIVRRIFAQLTLSVYALKTNIHANSML